ncbi:MAG: ABC transporter permease [Thermodesulfobacteriota bacterium]|nr:ABC transporter permease [Thermodesulfobacteriota bacterium]
MTVYEPNHILRAGIRNWAEMLREVVEFRGLVWRLVIRDISARYKQSVIGILWAFLSPLVMMAAFVWVKGRNILPIGETVLPYAAFVFLGQMVWLLFSQGVTASANSLVAAGAMLTKINFPREVLVLAALGQTVFEFLIRIPVLALVFLWVGFTPHWAIVLVPFTLVPLLFMVAGIGFFLSLFNAIIRDVGNILGIVLALGMFATPVIYPPPTTWPLSFWVNYVNPVSPFVTTCRDLATVGHVTDPTAYFSAVLLSGMLFLIGWRVFHLSGPKIAERI